MVRLIFIYLFVFAVPLSLEAGQAPRQNFVVVMVVDMGYAGVSCFGNPYARRPMTQSLPR